MNGRTDAVGDVSEETRKKEKTPGRNTSHEREGVLNLVERHLARAALHGMSGWVIGVKTLFSVRERGPATSMLIADGGLAPCVGAFFSIGSVAGTGIPAWIVGDSFLKNVYSVFRASPPSVGFAQLSDAAGGSSGEFYVSLLGRPPHEP